MNPVAVLALGGALGAGLLLGASPWLWPARAVSAPASEGLRARLRVRLAIAGLPGVPLAAVLAVSLIVGICTGAIVFALFGVEVLAGLAAALGLALPALAIEWRVRSRRSAQRTVWPDVVDHLLSGVRAGLALPDAVTTLATSGPAQTRVVFAEYEREYRLSGSFGRSLDRLKALMADPVADRLIETLRMAREVGGGDLVEVLRETAGFLREDAAVRAELRARQSWIVNAARLGVVAPWLVLLLLVSRPEGAAAYDSPTGAVVIVAGGVVSVIAYRLMLRVGRLPEQQRWFR